VLVGGGARSDAVRQIVPAVLGLPVAVPAEGEWVAVGAARQAAWASSGSESPPAWPVAMHSVQDARLAPLVHEQYAAVRELTATVDQVRASMLPVGIPSDVETE
jgi:xylulokinase